MPGSDTNRLKVGAVNYINALPFFAAFQLEEVPTTAQFIYNTPARLNQALALGEIDIGLVSSIEYLKNRISYSLLPQFGITAYDRVMSVCLYTRCPLSELDGKNIGTTVESASSIALLEVLCEQFWDISVTMTPISTVDEGKTHEAFLIIGDQCLQHQHLDGYTTIDLAQAWYYATGLPFTFALFVRRHDHKIDEEIVLFQQQLQDSLIWAQNNRETIEDIAVKRCSISQKLIREYFSLIHYSLNDHMLEGLAKFNHYYDEISQK